VRYFSGRNWRRGVRGFTCGDGFTVIEMLVVLALSSMLLVGLLAAVNLFVRFQDKFQDEYPVTGWKNRVVEQLREDVVNSREYRVSFDSLELVGYAAHDFSTGAATMRASNIRYSIETVGETMWLVREEAHYDQTNRVVSSRELVGAGVAAIQFERLETAIPLRFAHLKRQAPMVDFARIPDRIYVGLIESFSEEGRAAEGDSRALAEGSVDGTRTWNFNIYQR